MQPTVWGVVALQKMAWEVIRRHPAPKGCEALGIITQSLPRPGHGVAARFLASTVCLADTAGFLKIQLALSLSPQASLWPALADWHFCT